MIYDLILSKGSVIKIDEEDLEVIKDNIGKSLIKIKQGIFNPSFMVTIVPTNQSDVIEKYKIETQGNIAKITGTEEIKVLPDLMSKEVKKLS